MGHAAEMEVSGRVETFPVETVKQRGGGGAIKTAVVKTEPYAGHVEREFAFLSLGADFSRDKAPNNASRSFGSQAEIPSTKSKTLNLPDCACEYNRESIAK
jgi:hypothetical protein